MTEYLTAKPVIVAFNMSENLPDRSHFILTFTICDHAPTVWLMIGKYHSKANKLWLLYGLGYATTRPC